MTFSFLFDLNKCTGCHACQLACSIENEVDLELNWRQIVTFNNEHHPNLPTYHLSLACNHCLDAPCEKYCPALAYERDKHTGILSINSEKCIGCKYCSWVCPYDAPKYDAVKGIMEKCHFCKHRLDEGLEPACVSLCPTNALQISNDIETFQIHNNILGFSEIGIKPQINLTPIRKGFEVPQQTAPVDTQLYEVQKFYKDQKNNSTKKIELKSEWVLIVFSLISAAVVALMAGSIFGRLTINTIQFMTLSLIGIGLSSMHLGNKIKAYRPIYNFRYSWLSREVILFSVFLLMSFIFLNFTPTSKWLVWILMSIGFGLLISIDRVYDVIPQMNKYYLHSAKVLLTSILLATIFLEAWLITTLMILLKSLLYMHRKYIFYLKKKNLRIIFSIFRIVLGMILPLASLFLLSENKFIVILTLVMLGEIIDRIEFYLELDILSPSKQMKIDFKKKLLN